MINTETEIERGDSVCLLHLLNKKDNCKKKKTQLMKEKNKITWACL